MHLSTLLVLASAFLAIPGTYARPQTCKKDACYWSVASDRRGRGDCANELVVKVTPRALTRTRTLTSTKIAQPATVTKKRTITNVQTSTVSVSDTSSLTISSTIIEYSTVTKVVTTVDVSTATITTNIVSTISRTLQPSITTVLKRGRGPAVPKYANKCGSYDCWASACSCLGVKTTTIRAPTPTVWKTSTVIRTVTRTQTKSVVETSTSQAVVTKGATVFVTATVSTTLQIPTTIDQTTTETTTTTATVSSVSTTTLNYCADAQPTFALTLSGGTNSGKYITLGGEGQLQPFASEDTFGTRFYISGGVVHTVDNDRSVVLTSAVDGTFAVDNFRSLASAGGNTAASCFLGSGNSGALSCTSGSARRSWWMDCNPSPGCSISTVGLYRGINPDGSDIPACGNCQKTFVFSKPLCVVTQAT